MFICLFACVALSLQDGSDELTKVGEFQPLSADRKSEVEFILRKVQSERERLRSGVARIHGRRTVASTSNPEHDIDGEIEGLLAFDFDHNIFRVEMSIPLWAILSSVGGDPAASQAKPKLEQRRLNSVRNSDYFACYESIGTADTNLMVHQSDRTYSEGLRGFYNVIDLRSLGMIDLFEFRDEIPIYGERATSQDIAVLAELSSVVDGFVMRTPKRLTRSEGLITIELPFYTIVLDANQGYTPIEYYNTFIDRIRFQSKAKWERADGIWVPVMVSLSEYDEWEDDHSRISWHLEWSHINRPVPDELQQFETFPDVPNGTAVIDDRGSKAQTLGKLIDRKVVREIVRPTPPTSLSRLLVVASIFAFAIGTSVWAGRRLMRSSTD